MKSIFEHKNYRKYLVEYLDNQPKRGRGLRRLWAEAAGCQVAYISHVLGGSHNLSLEQAEAISTFIGHSKEETEFFLLLVERARASTPSLKAFLQQMLEQKIADYQNIRTRMKIKESLKSEDQIIYYSKWLYSAIHMLLTIPEFQTAAKVAEYFSLTLPQAKECLDFLETRHLIESKGGRYSVRGNLLHVSKDSPLFYQQQITWRQKAIEAIYKNKSEEIHFASCFSVSARDIGKVRDLFLRAIEESTEIIKPSKEEKLYSICLDMFEVQ